jgi:hypothetical protein
MGWFKRREIDPDDLPATEAELARVARQGAPKAHPASIRLFARNAAKDGRSVNDVYDCWWFGADD